MTSTAIHPSSLGGIKRLATFIKREHQIPHTKALDVAAVRAGFTNFRHAQNQLAHRVPTRRANAVERPFWITAYWRDKEGRAGRETLQVEVCRGQVISDTPIGSFYTAIRSSNAFGDRLFSLELSRRSL